MITLLDGLSIADQTAAISAALAITIVALIVGVAVTAVLHPDSRRRQEAREVLRILLAPRGGT